MPYQWLRGHHLDARAQELLRLYDRRLIEVGGERVEGEPGAVPGEGAAPGRAGSVQVWKGKQVLDDTVICGYSDTFPTGLNCSRT